MKKNLSGENVREAAIPLSSFCRSVFGVSLNILLSPPKKGECFCSRSLGADSTEEECLAFHKNLFTERSVVRVACPAGVSMIACPLRLSGNEEILVLTDGFIEKEASPADLPVGGRDLPRLTPSETDHLRVFVEKAATTFALVAAGAREIVPEDDGIADWRSGASAYSLIGSSDGISRIRETLPTFANSSEPVLIESEHGNGRHLIATMIHRLGLRTEGPLIFENLALLPETLHEKELFGPKGNGSGGLVGHAGGGTLFLDGIEHLSSPAQRRLHSHLAGNEGGRGEGPSARIVASTDRNLSELVRRGRFRSDLQRRISKLTLFIPPLRDRKEDIPLLTAHFLDRLPVGSSSNGSGSGTVQAEKDTVQSLQEYSWPGNVRELEKELEQAAAYGHSTIRLRDFSAPIQHAARPPKATMKSIREAVGILETEMISQTLSDTNWNKSQAARILGLSRLGLQKKIDRYGLDRRR